jgi:hypothetical protein
MPQELEDVQIVYELSDEGSYNTKKEEAHEHVVLGVGGYPMNLYRIQLWIGKI